MTERTDDVQRVRSRRVLKRYIGDSGRDYAAWQVRGSRGLGTEVSRRFSGLTTTDSVVLDFGCGSGEVLLNLPAVRRIGVEPNAYASAFAKERGIELHRSLSAVEPRSVDVVITNHALEHCTHPFEELDEMRRVLKLKGMLVVVVPVDDWRSQRSFRPSDVNHHLYCWTPLALGNLLTEAGFTVKELRVLTHAWPPRAASLWAHLPSNVFDVLAFAWAVFRRRRQIRAVASLN